MYSKFEGHMRKKISFKFIVFFFFYLQIVIIHSQTDSNHKDYYNWFDTVVGDGNIGIYDGTNYKEKYITINGNHKYYLTSEFLVGDVVYDDQPYFDIKMKYDIYNDELIVKLPIRSGFSVIQLVKEKIEVFTINNRPFIRISERSRESLSEDHLGFYEILFKSDRIILYKKYKKYRSEHLDKEFAYNEFKLESNHLIYYNNHYNKINSKRNLIKLFPKQRTEINTFYNKNRLLQKSNLDIFMTQLMKLLSNNIIDNKTAY